MEILGPDGNALPKDSKQIEEILRKIIPKNKEQERILAQKIGEKIEQVRQERMRSGLKGGFNNTFKKNTRIRQSGGGRSESGEWQLIAAIPPEMAYVARQIWGDDVFTNDKKFEEAFIKDEMGQYCLTVDPKTL